MKRILHFLLIVFCPFFMNAQNYEGSYNPYVNQGIIAISPHLIAGESATGVASFNIGNTGSDPLSLFTDEYLKLIITFSDGEPDHANPLSAIGGSSADLFSWTYNAGLFTGIQISAIPPNSAGDITIAYKATDHSSSPGSNGFSVELESATYQNISNTENDDVVSSYTYMDFADYGDAPASYGEAYHILDFINYLGATWDGEGANQPSSDATGDDLTGDDDEDGIIFTSLFQLGELASIQVSVSGQGLLNGWIDWNGDGDFEDSGERIADNLIQMGGTEILEVLVPEDAVISLPTFARFRFSPEALYSSQGAALGGEVEDFMISLSASPHAPAAPTGLRVDLVSDDSVSLAWNAPSDPDGVTGYNIYRGGVFLASTETLAFTDHSVLVGETYTYTVTATNAAGFESDLSSAFAVYIDDTTPPTIPGSFRITSVDVGGVMLTWEASADNVSVQGYRVYRSGVLLETVSTLSYFDNNVAIDDSYTYTVTAIDAAGNESAMSTVFAVYIEDMTAPSVPTGFNIVAVSDDGVSLSWEASLDDVGVSAYRLYRSGSLLETVFGLTYTDNSIIFGNTYSYTVSALDASGNESDQTASLTFTATSIGHETSSKLLIYPNPSDGHFVIDLDASGRYFLEIVALSGAILLQNTIDMFGSSLPLNLAQFQAGVYYVRIFNNESSYFGKLVIVR